MPTFGQVLRGFRLGYKFDEKRNCFIRLGVDNTPQVTVEISPNNQLVPAKSATKNYVCWWEEENGGEVLLNLIPRLKNIKNPKRHIKFFIDKETGE